MIELNCDPTGNFAHTPEPIPENLTQISDLLKTGCADVGFVVDPDVDRLAIVMENGEMFVEEYTLVAVADYILSKTPGATVSNLSSSRALRDVTERHGCKYTASAVGEVNVVTQMKTAEPLSAVRETAVSSTLPATTAATLSLAWLCSSLSLPTKAKGVGAQEGVSSILHREKQDSTHTRHQCRRNP